MEKYLPEICIFLLLICIFLCGIFPWILQRLFHASIKYGDEIKILAVLDKYLDVLMTPEGEYFIDDENELEAAFKSGELSKNQYEDALKGLQFLNVLILNTDGPMVLYTCRTLVCSDQLKIVTLITAYYGTKRNALKYSPFLYNF